MEILNIAEQFGTTMAALFVFAIWTNSKFSSITQRISKIEGHLKI